MKVLIFHETGEPSGVLELAEIPTPPLAPGEALVRVLLTPINPSDLHMVRVGCPNRRPGDGEKALQRRK
jgi:NADPH2:quinone reductase